MGWGIDWVSSGGSDFNRDLGFLHTEEELKPFLEGEIPPTVEQNARMCGTDVAGYVVRGTGPERVRAIGRDRLPDLRNDRPRPRARDGLLRPAGPDAEGTRRGRLRAAVGAAPRRVRDGQMSGSAQERRVLTTRSPNGAISVTAEVSSRPTLPKRNAFRRIPEIVASAALARANRGRRRSRPKLRGVTVVRCRAARSARGG